MRVCICLMHICVFASSLLYNMCIYVCTDMQLSYTCVHMYVCICVRLVHEHMQASRLGIVSGSYITASRPQTTGLKFP